MAGVRQVHNDLVPELKYLPVTARPPAKSPETVAWERPLLYSEIPEPARFSHRHHGQKKLLDHILISRSLLAAYRHAEIHNEVLRDESIAFAGDAKFLDSDHAPFVLELDF